MSVLAELRWPILERIPLVGDLAVSPHGISIALGFLFGAGVMMRRAQLRGVARRHVTGIPDLVQNLIIRGSIGTILGARFFYVITHWEPYRDDVLGVLRIWEGGLSLIGGIAGALLLAIPYGVKRRLSVPLLLDSLAPALALGIFIGRIGDLVIGEHLGGPTTFFLGWRCTGDLRDPSAPVPYPGPVEGVVQGCFDATLHQTALYDFLAAGLVFAALLWLERRPRFDGFFLLAFTVLYGAGRFLTDFAREADRDLVGTLTGSQVAIVAAIIAAALWVRIFRPDLRWRPYAWSPPDFDHPWDPHGRPGHMRDEAEDDVGGPGEAVPDPTATAVGEPSSGGPQDPHSERFGGGYSSPDGAR